MCWNIFTFEEIDLLISFKDSCALWVEDLKGIKNSLLGVCTCQSQNGNRLLIIESNILLYMSKA